MWCVCVCVCVCVQESYFKAMLNAPIVVEGDEELEIEYDSDGNPMIPDSAKVPWDLVFDN